MTLLADVETEAAVGCGRCLVTAGTDGQDGPTDAAGAYCDGLTWDRGLAAGLSPLESLESFDSYSFFEKEGGLIRTGTMLLL